VNWHLHAKLHGSSPQRVALNLPNIATLHRGTYFTDIVWSWCPRLPALNEVLSPVLPLNCLGQHVLFHGICHHHHFLARLVLSGGRGGLWKRVLALYRYACDYDEKDGRPLNREVSSWQRCPLRKVPLISLFLVNGMDNVGCWPYEVLLSNLGE
jgi:hypothetical protein